MKKTLFNLLVALSLTAMLVACAGPSKPPTEPPKPTAVPTAKPTPTEAGEKEVVFEFWIHDTSKVPGMQAVIDGFQAKYPNITVNMTQVAYEEYQAKIAAAVPAGTGPDALMLYYGWVPLWEKSGFIAPLAPEVQEVLNKEFVPFVEITKVGGKHYAVPTSIRNGALFYNVKILKEAGWDRPPDTWDEFLQCAIDCTKYDAAGNVVQAGYFNQWSGDGWNWWRPLIRAFGGQPFSEDYRKVLWNEGEGARKAWQFVVDLTKKYKVYTPGFYEKEHAAFAAGLTAMHIRQTFMVGYLRKNAAPDLEWAVTKMPEGPAGRFTYGSSIPIAMTTKALRDPDVLDAVTKFMLFQASQEGQTLYCDQIGELPARLDMLDDPKYTEDPVMAPFIAQLPQTFGAFWCDEMAERQCCLDMYDAVVAGGADPMRALDNSAACVQRIRDEFFGESD